MNDKVKDILNSLLRRFEIGDIPQAIAIQMFPRFDIPCSKWSLMNRLVMWTYGTNDARGFRQWQQAGRSVKKGAKAFYILAPRFHKVKSEQDEDITILSGFLSVPVFRYEDTEGKPLDYTQLELPKLPLMDVAEKWGLNVKAVPGNCRWLGCYSMDTKSIELATKAECVFFHELAHAAHERVKGKLEGGQDWRQEIVAEFSALVLCELIGKDPSPLGHSHDYIKKYAERGGVSPLTACTGLITEVEAVLAEIIKVGKEVRELCAPEASIPLAFVPTLSPSFTD